MKKSFISPISAVKQKNESASACSRRRRRRRRSSIIPWKSSRFAGQPTSVLEIRVRSHDVINRSNDLVHALHVIDSRIEFRVEEENPFDHLPVCLPAIFHGVVALRGDFRNQFDLCGRRVKDHISDRLEE